MSCKLLIRSFFFLIFGICVSNSQATIIVSGDMSIVYAIDPSFPAEYQLEGNKRFFRNILQSSRNGSHVAIINKEVDLSLWNPQTLEEAMQDTFCREDLNYAVAAIDSFYSSFDDITSSVIDAVTAPALEAADLLVVPLLGSPFSTDELSAMSGFVDGGGSVFFIGEAFDHPEQNANINLALSGMGSTLRIAENSGLDICDSTGPRYASGAQIGSTSLTNGIESFFYGYVSEIASDSGWAAPLFTTQESGGVPFIAYERPLSVPEPSGVLLFIISAPALLLSIRRKRR